MAEDVRPPITSSLHKIKREFVNNLINKLSVKLHLSEYQFCEPGTKLETRLTQKDKVINLLDSACKEHDIAYSQSRDTKKRYGTHQILAEKT